MESIHLLLPYQAKEILADSLQAIVQHEIIEIHKGQALAYKNSHPFVKSDILEVLEIARLNIQSNLCWSLANKVAGSYPSETRKVYSDLMNFADECVEEDLCCLDTPRQHADTRTNWKENG